MSARTDTPGSASLRAWGDELRRRRRARSRLLLRGGLTGLGCAAVGLTILSPPAPRLVWNASASAPVGLYAVSPDVPVQVGDMVIAWPPKPVRSFAATRRYLPLNMPLVKRIAAGPGDRICAVGTLITVNGRSIVRRHDRDGHGRPMPIWTGCRSLHDRQYLLLMADTPTSFDGRYFGVTDASDIVGRARLLWRR